MTLLLDMYIPSSTLRANLDAVDRGLVTVNLELGCSYFAPKQGVVANNALNKHKNVALSEC